MRHCFSLLVLALLAACASAPAERAATQSSPPAQRAPLATTGTARLAIANLAAASGTLVSGRVELRPAVGGVRITGVIGGLSRNGAHGLQVHARGDCSAVDASSAGDYFDAGERGDGSGGRTVANADGVASVDLLVPGAVLGGGARNDIDGRALLVLGATAGATSARIACGIITAQP
ncbi:MAG: superoxide dismutase family protein [Luteimonas sp.]